MEMLLRYDIPKTRKKELRNLLLYFKDVGTLDIYNINWNFRFNRNNQSYQMLMSVCYLVIKGLLQTTADGTVKLMQFFGRAANVPLVRKVHSGILQEALSSNKDCGIADWMGLG